MVCSEKHTYLLCCPLFDKWKAKRSERTPTCIIWSLTFPMVCSVTTSTIMVSTIAGQICAPVTLTQNVWNRRKFKKPSRSKYKGVDWSTEMKRWRARIRVNGKRIYLGSFKHEIEAAKAYDTAAAKHHGQFAALNFKSSRKSQPHNLCRRS